MEFLEKGWQGSVKCAAPGPEDRSLRRGRTSIVGGLLRVNDSQEAHWTGEWEEFQTRTSVVKFHASRGRWRRTRHLAAVGVVGDVNFPTLELLPVLHHPLGPLARSRRGLLEVLVPLEVVADDFVALENDKAKKGQPIGRAGLEGSERDAPCETRTFRSSRAGLHGRQRAAWLLVSFAERREGGRAFGGNNAICSKLEGPAVASPATTTFDFAKLFDSAFKMASVRSLSSS